MEYNAKNEIGKKKKRYFFGKLEITCFTFPKSPSFFEFLYSVYAATINTRQVMISITPGLSGPLRQVRQANKSKLILIGKLKEKDLL